MFQYNRFAIRWYLEISGILSAQIESRVKIYNFNLLKGLINHSNHRVARIYFQRRSKDISGLRNVVSERCCVPAKMELLNYAPLNYYSNTACIERFKTIKFLTAAEKYN